MRIPARGYAARRNKWFGLNRGALIGITAVAAFAALWLTGVINPGRWFRASSQLSRRGMVAIPVSGVPIPAYTRITRDHLWNPKAGAFALIYLRPEQVSPDIVRSQMAIIGRVMDHDKPPAYAFTEADFLPPGTKPGLVAGIPAGKRAMRVPADKITGLVGLLAGDRFDLISALPIDAAGAGGGALGGGLYSKQLELQARLTNWQKQATVRVIVQNGNVVQPMTTRQVPVANNTLTSGLVIRTRPVQEVVIAVAPAEVARLAEALAVNAEISCVPRSGRPDDPRDSTTPELSPFSPFGGAVARPTTATYVPGSGDPSIPPATGAPGGLGAGFAPIETISGSKREIVAAPVKR
jgi:Flp pilus assembly protein CpaB